MSDQLDMFAPMAHPVFGDFPPAMARLGDAETAHEAARVTEISQAHEGRVIVLQLLRDHGPLTQFDPYVLCKKQQTHIGPRFAQLTRKGLVERYCTFDADGVHPVTRKPLTGAQTDKRVSVWAITDAGRQWLADYERGR